MYKSDKRLRQALCGIAVTGALVLTGCASTGTKVVDNADQSLNTAAQTEKSASKKVTVEYINVVGDGDRVLIGTTGSIKYTVFKLTDPSRIIVDMPGVNLDKITSPISVNNDYLKQITAVSYGEDKEIGRLIIGLRDGVDHEVKSGENSILVSLQSMTAANKSAPDAQAGSVMMASSVVEEELAADAVAPAAEAAMATEAAAAEAAAVTEQAAAAPETAAEAPATQVALAEVPAAEEIKPAPQETAAEMAEPLAQAQKILKVVSHKEGDNTIIEIKTDGLIGNFNSFALDDPARIVVDIWTIGNATGKDIIKMKDDYVKDVRIGSHPEKTRLVLDAAVKNLPLHNVSRDVDTITVTVGPNAMKAAVAAPEHNTAYASKAAELEVAHVPEPVVATAAVTEPAPAEEAAPVMVPAAPPEQVAAVDESAAMPAMADEPVVEEPVVEEPVVEAPVTEPPMIASAYVQRVDFKKVGDAGRLTVVSNEKVSYEAKDSPDGKTVIIDLKGATIPESLHRTLDASKLDTSVSAVSSYQDKDSQVRLLVKLKEKVKYAIEQDGRTLTVEFAPPAPEVIDEAALAELGSDAVAGEPGQKYTGKKIDIDMMDANVRDVLRLLAEISNLNIVASDDVAGKISLRLKNVPWDQAFDIILQTRGLGSIKEGNIVRVAPAAKIRQEKETLLASRKAQQKLEDLEIEFVPVNYASATELVTQIQDVLTDRGSVSSDSRTNTLIVKDVRDGIDAVLNLVKKLDTPIPQVLIEARIVEATSSFARDLGIQWGVDYQTGGKVSTNTFGSTTTAGQAVAATTTAPVFGAAAGAQNFAVNLPATGTAGTLGALGFILGNAGSSPLVLDLRLSAGETEGRLKTISRPRITTMDNKEAKIEQGESIPFETTSASGTSTTFIDANLSLTVTPHITPDGSVLMKIKASRNSIGTFRTSSGEPSINKKESSTEVLVRDGETTVIGGIVISDKNNTERGIPVLKDIPLLGWIFKNRSISDTQTELLIFITPTILKEKITG